MCVSRYDRPARTGGGIAMYAKCGLDCVVHVSRSKAAARDWHYLHSDRGIIAIGNCYRPPGSLDSVIESLHGELSALVGHVIGIMLLGGFNIHHR